MPTSDPRTISVIVHRAVWVWPLSVLDLGIGYGKMGALMGEYLDFNRYNEMKRHIKIVGVEGFPGYRTAAWDHYDEVRLENFGERSNRDSYVDFGLVLMVDSLEHLEKAEAIALLEHLVSHNRHVIVSTPSGESPQAFICGTNWSVTVRRGRLRSFSAWVVRCSMTANAW